MMYTLCNSENIILLPQYHKWQTEIILAALRTNFIFKILIIYWCIREFLKSERFSFFLIMWKVIFFLLLFVRFWIRVCIFIGNPKIRLKNSDSQLSVAVLTFGLSAFLAEICSFKICQNKIRFLLFLQHTPSIFIILELLKLVV